MDPKRCTDSVHRLRALWLRALIVVSCAACLGPLSVMSAAAAVPTAHVQLPPLVPAAGVPHHPGKVVWLDLVTPDLVSEEHFYAALLGWQFQDIRTARHKYAIAFVDGRPVAGLLEQPIPRGQRRQSAWLTYLSVDDIQAAKRTAVAHGAKLLADIRNYPQRGAQAVFADPEGAVFGVMETSSGDPEDALADPGDRIWSDLFCRDPEHEAGFYQALFGYEVFDLPTDDAGAEHLLLSSGGYARAGVNAFAPNSRQRPAHWLNFVRVASTTAAATQAINLGGHVLVQPRAGRHGDKLAVISDPTGAPLGLMEWSEAASETAPTGAPPARPESP